MNVLLAHDRGITAVVHTSIIARFRQKTKAESKNACRRLLTRAKSDTIGIDWLLHNSMKDKESQ